MTRTRNFMLALIGVLLVALLFTAAVEAKSIRNSCTIYTENRVDPIAFTTHLHRQFGNTSTSNESTDDSLFNHTDTSCELGAKWWTNAGWFPVERYEDVPNIIVYYRDPGDHGINLVGFQRGMELIAKNDPTNKFAEIQYSCASGPGKTTGKQATPPYDCTANWATHITFPRCWDGNGKEHTDFRYGPNRGSCPSTHPHVMPEINFLIRHPNRDGVVPEPLQISMGDGQWGDYTMMHADYIFAAQDEFNNAVDKNGDGRISTAIGKDGAGYNEQSLMDLCFRSAPKELEFHHERCRAYGLKSWHKTAINNYYGY